MASGEYFDRATSKRAMALASFSLEKLLSKWIYD